MRVGDGTNTLAPNADGSIDVGNFPATQTVDDGGGSLTVDGSVSVSNFPAVQSVDDNGGSLTVDGTVSVDNFPATQTVDDGGGSLTVDGSVAVSNFPAVQSVDDNGGSLTVDDGGTPLSVSQTTTNASFQVATQIAGTALTDTYQNVKTLSADATIVTILNTCDEPVRISFDAGVTDHQFLDVGQSFSWEFGAQRQVLASGTDIRVRRDVATPTVGRVTVSAV